MTQFPVVREGPVAIVEPHGRIDARAARDFEKVAAGLFGERVRLIIVDGAHLDLMSAPGIRVLLMIRKRLDRIGGGLALCALNDRVRGVLDVAGLLGSFRLTATRAEALAELGAIGEPVPAAAAPRVSALTRLVMSALPDEGVDGGAPVPSARSALTTLVVRTLERPDR